MDVDEPAEACGSSRSRTSSVSVVELSSDGSSAYDDLEPVYMSDGSHTPELSDCDIIDEWEEKNEQVVKQCIIDSDEDWIEREVGATPTRVTGLPTDIVFRETDSRNKAIQVNLKDIVDEEGTSTVPNCSSCETTRKVLTSNLHKLLFVSRKEISSLKRRIADFELREKSTGTVRCPNCHLMFRGQRNHVMPKYLRVLRGKLTVECEFFSMDHLREFLFFNGLDVNTDGMPTLLELEDTLMNLSQVNSFLPDFAIKLTREMFRREKDAEATADAVGNRRAAEEIPAANASTQDARKSDDATRIEVPRPRRPPRITPQADKKRENLNARDGSNIQKVPRQTASQQKVVRPHDGTSGNAAIGARNAAERPLKRPLVVPDKCIDAKVGTSGKQRVLPDEKTSKRKAGGCDSVLSHRSVCKEPGTSATKTKSTPGIEKSTVNQQVGANGRLDNTERTGDSTKEEQMKSFGDELGLGELFAPCTSNSRPVPKIPRDRSLERRFDSDPVAKEARRNYVKEEHDRRPRRLGGSEDRRGSSRSSRENFKPGPGGRSESDSRRRDCAKEESEARKDTVTSSRSRSKEQLSMSPGELPDSDCEERERFSLKDRVTRERDRTTFNRNRNLRSDDVNRIPKPNERLNRDRREQQTRSERPVEFTGSRTSPEDYKDRRPLRERTERREERRDGGRHDFERSKVARGDVPEQRRDRSYEPRNKRRR